MTNKLKGAALVIGAVVALGVGGTAIAGAVGGDDDATDKPISGPALEQAKQAALAEIPGGKATETEVGDEESKYEVEVTKADGSQVDVQLDEQFNVVGTEADSDTTED